MRPVAAGKANSRSHSRPVAGINFRNVFWQPFVSASFHRDGAVRFQYGSGVPSEREDVRLATHKMSGSLSSKIPPLSSAL